MSSILDALNKLEDEREREAFNARAALDAELAARDLMGEGDGPRYTVSLGPIALAAAGIALVMVVAATAALVTWMVRAEPVDVAAVSPPVEVARTAAPATTPSAPPPHDASALGVSNDDAVEDAAAEVSEPASQVADAAPDRDAAAPSEPMNESANGWAQALALSAGVSADALDDVPAETTAPVSNQSAPVRDVPAVERKPVSVRPPAADSALTATTMTTNGAAEAPTVAAPEETASTPELLRADAGPVVVSPSEEVTAPAPAREPAAPTVTSELAFPASPPPGPDEYVSLNAFEVAAKADDAVQAEQDWPADMRELPALSPAVKAKIGLEDFVVNMPMPATNARPVASAIINRMKVYKNERVLNTRVRLVDVATHGVAIEVIDTGDRYYVRH